MNDEVKKCMNLTVMILMVVGVSLFDVDTEVGVVISVNIDDINIIIPIPCKKSKPNGSVLLGIFLYYL
jgi:hypothetical protein